MVAAVAARDAAGGGAAACGRCRRRETRAAAICDALEWFLKGGVDLGNGHAADPAAWQEGGLTEDSRVEAIDPAPAATWYPTTCTCTNGRAGCSWRPQLR